MTRTLKDASIGRIHRHGSKILVENGPDCPGVINADRVIVVHAAHSTWIPILRHEENGVWVAITVGMIDLRGMSVDVRRCGSVNKRGGAGGNARTGHPDGSASAQIQRPRTGLNHHASTRALD